MKNNFYTSVSNKTSGKEDKDYSASIFGVIV
jgi:hypothetical protein